VCALCSLWLGFWTLSIVRYSKNNYRIVFRKLNLFPCSGKLKGTVTVRLLRLALSKGLNRLGDSAPSPEHGNRCRFGSVVS
jgi:hypothetical protein